MTRMNTLALIVAAAAALGGAGLGTAAAHPEDDRGGCEEFGCGTNNGPKLTGIALPSLASKRPVVTAVKLPSDETVYVGR